MSGSLRVEDVDLEALAAGLRAALGTSVEGPVVGRTALRDEVVRALTCSTLEAEQLVDTLVATGLLVLDQSPDHPARWLIAPR